LSNWEPGYPYLIFLLSILAFLFFIKIASYISGWNNLAKLYQTQEKFEGRKWFSQRIGFRSADYGRVVIIGVNNTGLFLGMQLFFKLGHPDLVIPLRELSGKETAFRLFGKIKLHKYVKVTFESAPGVYITMAKSLADSIEEVVGNRWKYERLQQD